MINNDMNPFEQRLPLIARLSDAETRSISPENPDGFRGGGARATEGVATDAACDLGPAWKISPYVRISAGETFDLPHIEGPGVIRHIWLTPTRDGLAEPDSADLLGRPGMAFGGMPAGRLLRHGLEHFRSPLLRKPVLACTAGTCRTRFISGSD